jgi:hypothetical protein
MNGPNIVFYNKADASPTPSDTLASGCGKPDAIVGAEAFTERSELVGTRFIMFPKTMIVAGYGSIRDAFNDIHVGDVVWLNSQYASRRFNEIIHVSGHISSHYLQAYTPFDHWLEIHIPQESSEEFLRVGAWITLVGRDGDIGPIYTHHVKIIELFIRDPAWTSIKTNPDPTHGFNLAYQLQIEPFFEVAADVRIDPIAAPNGCTWVVGGKRLTLHNSGSYPVFKDALPGWKITLEKHLSPYYVPMGTNGFLDISASGNTSKGIHLIGSGGTVEVTKNSTSTETAPTAKLSASGWTFKNILFTHTGPGDAPVLEINSGGQRGNTFKNCGFYNPSSGFKGYGILYSGNSPYLNTLFDNCHFYSCAGGAIYRKETSWMQSYGLRFIACLFEKNAGINSLMLESLRGTFFWECILHRDYNPLHFKGTTGDSGFAVVVNSILDGGNAATIGVQFFNKQSQSGFVLANCGIHRWTWRSVVVASNLLKHHDFFLGYNALGKKFMKNADNYNREECWDDMEEVDVFVPGSASVDRFDDDPGYVRPEMTSDTVFGGEDYGLGSDILIEKGFPRPHIGGGPYTNAVAADNATNLDIGVSQQLSRPPLFFSSKKVT